MGQVPNQYLDTWALFRDWVEGQTLDPGIWYDADIMLKCKKQYEAGDGLGLLKAIKYCLCWNAQTDGWVENGFNSALDDYLSARARSLDEAFNVKRRKTWNRKSEERKRIKAVLVSCAVMSSRESGRPVDDSLFEDIGATFGIKKTLAKKYYYSVIKEMDPAKLQDVAELLNSHAALRVFALLGVLQPEEE